MLSCSHSWCRNRIYNFGNPLRSERWYDYIIHRNGIYMKKNNRKANVCFSVLGIEICNMDHLGRFSLSLSIYFALFPVKNAINPLAERMPAGKSIGMWWAIFTVARHIVIYCRTATDRTNDCSLAKSTISFCVCCDAFATMTLYIDSHLSSAWNKWQKCEKHEMGKLNLSVSLFQKNGRDEELGHNVSIEARQSAMNHKTQSKVLAFTKQFAVLANNIKKRAELRKYKQFRLTVFTTSERSTAFSFFAHSAHILSHFTHYYYLWDDVSQVLCVPRRTRAKKRVPH